VIEEGWLDILLEAFEKKALNTFGSSLPVGSASGVVLDKFEGKEKIVCIGHYQDSGATMHCGWNKDRSELDHVISTIPSRKVYCACLCAAVYTTECLRAVVDKFGCAMNGKLEHYGGCTDIGLKSYEAGFSFGFAGKDVICWKDTLKPSSNKNHDRKLREASNMRYFLKTYYSPENQEKFDKLRRTDFYQANAKEIEDRTAKVLQETEEEYNKGWKRSTRKVGDELDCQEKYKKSQQ